MIRKILDILSLVLGIVLVYSLFYIFHIGCPIKFMTGVSCAGCGMTRAWFCLFRGNIHGAVHYHPLFFIPPIVVVMLVFRNKINRKILYFVFAVFIVAFAAVYFIRLASPEDTVVVFEPENGFIYRTINNIIEYIKTVV